jgi:hypothetical protein
LRDDEREFWDRVAEYERQFANEDFHGRAVASALELRREADDMFADFANFAFLAGDTDDEQDYIRWLQKAGVDVSSRIDLVLGAAGSDDEAEAHLRFAYAILQEVCLDALSRRPVEPR